MIRTERSPLLRACLLVVLAVMLVLPSVTRAEGEPAAAPEPATITAKNGTLPYDEWIDGVWMNHLHRRANMAVMAPFAAEAFLRDALRVAPDRPENADRLADHYRRHGLAPMDEVMTAYARVLREEPASAEPAPPARAPRDWTAEDEELHQASAKKFAAGLTVEAEVDLRNLLHKHPRNRRLLLDLGLLYLQTSDWGMAAATLAYARVWHPGDFDVVNNLAISLDNAGRADLVPALLEQQLAHQPGDVYLIRNICQFAGAVGDHAKALDYARRWAALEPDNPDAQEALQTEESTGKTETP